MRAFAKFNISQRIARAIFIDKSPFDRCRLRVQRSRARGKSNVAFVYYFRECDRSNLKIRISYKKKNKNIFRVHGTFSVSDCDVLFLKTNYVSCDIELTACVWKWRISFKFGTVWRTGGARTTSPSGNWMNYRIIDWRYPISINQTSNQTLRNARGWTIGISTFPMVKMRSSIVCSKGGRRGRLRGSRNVSNSTLILK